MKEPKEQKAAEVADVIGIFTDLDRGNFVINAGRLFHELTESIVEVRGKGTLTIKLKVSPAGFSKDTGRVNQFEIQPEISIDKPEHPLRKSLFFVSEDSKLSRDDPDQEKLFAEDERKDVTQNG
jgi:hypothetical protein